MSLQELSVKTWRWGVAFEKCCGPLTLWGIRELEKGGSKGGIPRKTKERCYGEGRSLSRNPTPAGKKRNGQERGKRTTKDKTRNCGEKLPKVSFIGMCRKPLHPVPRGGWRKGCQGPCQKGRQTKKDEAHTPTGFQEQFRKYRGFAQAIHRAKTHEKNPHHGPTNAETSQEEGRKGVCT